MLLFFSLTVVMIDQLEMLLCRTFLALGRDVTWRPRNKRPVKLKTCLQELEVQRSSEMSFHLVDLIVSNYD